MASKPKNVFDSDYFSTDAYADYKKDVLSYVKTLSRKINRLLKNVEKPSILDVGCAHGHMLKYIKEVYGFKIGGLEFSDFAIKHANNSVRKFIKMGSILIKNNYPKNSFDVVFCQDVCEYLKEPAINKAIGNLTYWSRNYIFFSDIYKHSSKASQGLNPDPHRITSLTQKDYIFRFRINGAKFVTKFNSGNGGDILIFKKQKQKN